MKRTLSGEQNDFIFFHSNQNNQTQFEEYDELIKNRKIMESKKHIRIAAYFGQNLRRLCLLEIGILTIIVIQLLLVSILGVSVFPSGKEFYGYLKGDFLYKDYLGLVTGNCFCFGFLTFLLSFFLNKREFKNQTVIYREVLRNEFTSGEQKVQKKFLSPHIVYFSGLNQQIKKTDFEEELQEFIDYGRDNDTLSSENGSLILADERRKEREEKMGHFTTDFKKGMDFKGRISPPDYDESVDRIFVTINKDNSGSSKNIRNEGIL